MATYTENLNLIKPGQLENYNVDVANTNNEIIDNAIGNKQDKIPGKGMSSNDFTDEYKRKLDAVKKIYTFKGSVSTYNDLASVTEKEIGDTWNILNTGDNYSWNGTEWVEVGVDTDFTEIENELETLDGKSTQTNFTITSSFTIDDQSCFKLNNFLNVDFNIYNTNSTFSKASWVEIATLPSGYRPSNARYVSGVGTAAAMTVPTAIPIMIESSGAIKIYVQNDLKRIIANFTINI